MKKFIAEFKEFISRGNVMDMTVGIVVGSAFTKIINSLVADIVMPVMGVLTGKVNLSAFKWVITPASDGVEELAVTYGAFLQSLLDFLIIAFAVFCTIKTINSVKAKFEKKKEEEAAAAEPSKTELLLEEIRDALLADKN